AVKRSFVKTEFTRLMILSSKKSYLEESRLTFFINLMRRGYPHEKLELFAREVQYTSRVHVLLNKGSKPLHRGVPLLFPSGYNDVWKYINLNDVFEKITSYWARQGCSIAIELKGPVIKSLRRTENLFDKASRWNVELL
ncbi:hypothetical protein K440DRAFT_491262, partial [Wilcoxina mikolae CBS 423.85]